MARKYVRDKRGRFASTGATARGARLGGKQQRTSRVKSDNLYDSSVPKNAIAKSGERRVEQRANRLYKAGNRQNPTAMAQMTMARDVSRVRRGKEKVAARAAMFKGKSAKNESARAKYKAASGRARKLTKGVEKMKASGAASGSFYKSKSRRAANARGALTRLQQRRR